MIRSYLDGLNVAYLILDGGEMKLVNFLFDFLVDHSQDVDCP